MTDWFRKTSWTEEDQKDFWTRHKRARAHNKSQYLRIQALYLAERNDPALRNGALALLNLMIAEFPEKGQLASAHLQRAEIYLAQNRKDEAVSNFRAALGQERVYSNVQTNAWLDFGWATMTNKWAELYDEALEVLDERKSQAWMLPADYFRLHAIGSIIAYERGNQNEAKTLASEALVHAEQNHSGLRYHPQIGLVGKSWSSIVERLQQIRDS